MSSTLSNKNQNTSWMIAYITHNISEAHIIAGRLESEGIKSIINHMAGRSAIGITFGTMGEVRVLVHPNDYDRAIAIIDPEMDEQLTDDNDRIIFEDDWGDDDE